MHYITLFVIDIHNIRCFEPFYHSMTTLKFGSIRFETGTISWNLVITDPTRTITCLWETNKCGQESELGLWKVVLCYEIGSFRVKNDNIPDKLWAIFNPVHPPYLLRESFYDHRDCSGSINHPLVIRLCQKKTPLINNCF